MNTRDLLTSARARFETASRALGIGTSADIARSLDRLEALATEARAAVQRINQNRDLTEAARERQRAEARRAYEIAADPLTTHVQELVQKAEDHQRSRLRVPLPEGLDASGRMLAARQDALMILDRVDDDGLGRAMQTLARDRGDVGRLMLSEWSSRYLQARKSNAAAAEFHSVRDQLAAEWLQHHGVDHGADALAALAVMPEAHKGSTITTFVAQATAGEIAPQPTEPNLPTGPGTPETIIVQHGAHGT